MIIGITIMTFTFIPVIRGLEIVSIYEYVSLRFHHSLRIAVSCLYLLTTNLYMATTLVGPALAFQAVQGIDYWITIVITGAVCTFYTTLGGMKAVIWTDVFQCIVMLSSIIVVMVLATNQAGGLNTVFEYNNYHGRLDIFEFGPDPTIRLTFWGVLSLMFYSMGTMVNQGAVQRIMAAKSVGQAKGTVLLTIPLNMVMFSLLFVTGLALFAFYDNDLTPLWPSINSTFSPLDNITVPPQDWEEPNYVPNYRTPDQILIFFVSSKLGHIPGLQGLFVSCLFAGALSSISSGLNGLVAVILRDMILPWRRWRSIRTDQPMTQNDFRDTTITKGLTFLFGIVSTVLAFGVPYLGTFVQITAVIFSAFASPILGTYTLGMCYPRANTWGAFIAIIIGTSWGMWVSLGNVLSMKAMIPVLPFYKISFVWYGFMNWTVTVIFGIVVSEIRRCIVPSERKKKVDPKLLLSFLRPKHPPHEEQKSPESVRLTEPNEEKWNMSTMQETSTLVTNRYVNLDRVTNV
ncbi:sodium-dependent multivitamin transporter-like [Glandiceps talaboti]